MGVEGTYLEKIMQWHRDRSKADRRDRRDLRDQALEIKAPPSLAGALRQDLGVSVIAECKRRSPSRGELNEIRDPLALATMYSQGGARAISVLTDREFFSGSLDDLDVVASSLPIAILRKDFTVDERDIYDAKIHGASAVLLIVAGLEANELRNLHSCALEVGLDVLVETHDEAEIEIALAIGAQIIGINQRNLRDFSIDTYLASRLAPLIGSSAIKVAESGVSTPMQMSELLAAGFDAALIGESLVRSGSPRNSTAEFVLSGQPS